MANLGKAGPGLMGAVYSSLGRKSGKLLVGPRRGSDNAVISIGGGKVMVLTVDPVSIIPELGMGLSAWMSVHLIASDYATSGLSPEYATFSFDFPEELGEGDKAQYLRAIGRECRALGIAIAAGHTGTYPGSGFTIVGAGTMFGFGRMGGFVDPSMARPGDAVYVTKGAGLEAAASLALSFPRLVETSVGRGLASKARSLVSQCSTVADAKAAAKAGLGRGRVTSMHDATEGGVLGGLEEMAAASGNAFHVDTGAIPVSREAGAVCRAFGLDPLRSLSEGTLLITCGRAGAPSLERELAGARIPAARVGTVKTGEGLWATGKGGRARKVRHSGDLYWEAYAAASRGDQG